MKPEQTEHLIRTALIVVLLIAAGAALIFGNLDAQWTTRIEGVLAVLIPATFDALRVAAKRATTHE